MWNGVRSKAFFVGSGVPRGGLLRGKFFNLFMDRVLNTLHKKNLGCHLNTIFARTVAYADDLILLLPSFNGMQLKLS